MVLLISNSVLSLNLLLVGSRQAEIIIAKRLVQRRNNMTRVRVKPRSYDQGRCGNDAYSSLGHGIDFKLVQLVYFLG